MTSLAPLVPLTRWLAPLIALVYLLATPAQAAPPANGTWLPVPGVSDEFNGNELDLIKWTDHNASFLGNPPGIYVPENVEVNSGKLELWATAGSVPGAPSEYQGYKTSYVASRQTVLYGYFEVRAKPMPRAIDSGFWLYRWTPTGSYEVDIFEIGGGAAGHEKIVHTNTWVYLGDTKYQTAENTSADPQSWTAPVRLAKAFHVYGLEWTPTLLNFYFDGQLIRSTVNTHFHTSMQVRFSTETFPNWFGLPAKSELPSVFKVDYVRVWQRTD